GNAAGTAGQFDQLASPNTPYLNNGFHNATCGGSAGCHTTTGGDLKYINESNYVIKQRTIFHGFQDQDGDDIAAYIRSIATVTLPANARPWNPPFQPGPGISTGTANAFFAGCGADCVVTYGYADLYEYLAPGGSQASWAPGGRTIETRDIPSPYLSPDYKFSLPAIHPADGFPLGNFMTDVAQ